jgi:hypothetical protein
VVDRDDQRQAATIAVGIASGVTTACLAVLGALAALVTFIADRYEGRTAFWVLTGLAAALLVVATFLGAHGTAEIARLGYRGTWKWRTKKGLFNYQALVASAALVLIGTSAAVGLGAPRRVEPTGRPDPLEKRAVSALQALARIDRQRLAGDNAQRLEIQRRLDALERRVNRLATSSQP